MRFGSATYTNHRLIMSAFLHTFTTESVDLHQESKYLIHAP